MCGADLFGLLDQAFATCTLGCDDSKWSWYVASIALAITNHSVFCRILSRLCALAGNTLQCPAGRCRFSGQYIPELVQVLEFVVKETQESFTATATAATPISTPPAPAHIDVRCV